MTDQELIELIQTELPGDLTEEQLDRLRASMHESEEVREALLDELRMETTIAAHHVPRKKDEQQYVKKIQQMAAARKRWKYGWLVALMLWVTLIGSVIFVLSNIDFTKQPVDDPQLVLKKSGDPKAVDPVTDPDGKSDKTGGSVAGAGGDAKNPEKVGPDKVDPTPKEIKPVLMEFDPPWRLFDDSAARGDHAWRSKLSKLVRPRRNGPIKEHRGYDFLDVRGIFDVMPPDDKGRAIRLRFAHSNKWRLAFFSGNEGVGIERIHDGRLAAYSVKRPPNESTPHGLPADIPERFLRQQKFERIDSEINFNWGSGSPASGVSADDFAVRWTGKLLVPHDGSYRFVATSDDGVIVRINGERIIDDWIERWQTGSQSPVTLKKGAHDIEVLYFEAGGEAAMKLEWQTPGSPGKRIIPASALRTGTSHGLKGQYFYGSPLSQDQPITPPRVDDDNFRWRYLREGAIDLRYQDGHIVVARGDIVLLKAPMSRVPDSLTMEMAGRLYLAEALRLKPLNLKDNGFVADSTDESKPAKREWRLGPANEVAAAHRDYDYQVDRIKKREKGIAFQINHQARRIADEQKKWEAGNPALDKLPENIAAILKLAADKRSEEQANALSAYYASITPIFKNERAEIERWRKELVEKVPRDIGKIEKQDDGSIVFERTKDKARTTAELDVELGDGLAITLELSEPTPGTGVFFGWPNSTHRLGLFVGQLDGKNVLVYGDPFHRDTLRKYVKSGTAFDDRFFVRTFYRLDRIVIEFSRDQTRWVRVFEQEFDSREPFRDKVTVGIHSNDREGARRVRINGVKVERFSAIENLVDRELVSKAPEFGFTSRAKGARPSLTGYLSKVDEMRPKDISDADWRYAINLAMLNGNTPTTARQIAASDMITAAIAEGVAFDRIHAALRQLPYRATFQQQRAYSLVWSKLIEFFDLLAEREWASGDRNNLGKLLDTWYELEFREAIHVATSRDPLVPQQLFRLHLYDLYVRGEWEQLRTRAMQLAYLSRSGSGEQSRETGDYPISQLAGWMANTATKRLGSGPTVAVESGSRGKKMMRAWSHPLAVETDRETLNTVAEFTVAVDTKAFNHACRILTRHALPAGIAPVGDDGKLFNATHVMLRKAIESNEELHRTLIEKYEGVGRIRVRQALDAGDIEAVEAVATQFHGTAAALEAQGHLANRDLSMGNFFAAASRYEKLQAAPEIAANRKNEFAARHRLALAMAGELSEKPITKTVTLPDGRFSAQQFEQLISTLVEQRRTRADFTASRPADSVAPGPARLTIRKIKDLRTSDRRRVPRAFNGTSLREFAWASVQDSSRIIVHQHGSMHLIDLNDGRTIWTKNFKRRTLRDEIPRPSTPLIFGDRVIASVRHDRDEPDLMCFSLNDGKEIWKRRFDDGLVGDPIIAGPWLYVVSGKRQLGDYADLMVRRIAPETGESVLASRTARVRFDDSRHSAGRPLQIGDAIVFRAGNSLICTDLLGELRWIRRLEYLPADVDRALTVYRTMGDLIAVGASVIVTCPGSPNVSRVDIETGEQLWTYMQPDLSRLVGRASNRLILATDGWIEALDIETGKPAWRSATSAHPEAIMPAGDGTIIALTLDILDPKKNEMRDRMRRRLAVGTNAQYNSYRGIRNAVWYSTDTGKEISRTAIPDQGQSLYNVATMFASGNSIVAVTNAYERYGKSQSARLAVLTPSGSFEADTGNIADSYEGKLKFDRWYSLGPIKGGTFDRAFKQSIDLERRPGRIDLKKKSRGQAWVARPQWKDAQVHKLEGENCSTYLYRKIRADKARSLDLSLGSDDSIKVWLNGKLVLSHHISRAAGPDQERVTVRLNKGDNDLLMKIVNGASDFGFYFRVVK